MHADDPLGRSRLAGYLGDRERGRVRRDDGLRPQDLLELGDHAALRRDLFEHRFDDQIGAAEPREIRPAGDAAHDARGLAALEDALLRGVRREGANR